MKPHHSLHTIQVADMRVTVRISDYNDDIQYNPIADMLFRTLSLYDTVRTYLVDFEWNGDVDSIVFFNLEQQMSCVAVRYAWFDDIIVMQESFSDKLAFQIPKLMEQFAPFEALRHIANRMPSQWRRYPVTIKASKTEE